ncbi:hypothetical protein SAMN05444920_108271 [Nonomuraea solani]|uniref:Butirosin biosynthesis protein H, N-terminal n=1 Tax=Nonomuraea solani TaxID=1144553 RepID=A0A1H6E8K1_9ACTN|nr:hypothetical protein [Nonomuraea solani]SEG94060.1 hypothetical protein SAMN05444920_108271 [Nonomuraea solani]
MLTYQGSGPYCYAHSLAMLLGPAAPPVAVIETLTGSPFGMQLAGGTRPYFDPYAWDPELGLDAAIELLGQECERSSGGAPGEALERLRAAVARGPVLAGPVDMALLSYTPGGAGDHYVVVLAVEDETVVVHDPHGHPFATLPVADFLAAWRGEAVEYLTTPYVLRTGFRRVRETSVPEALRRSLPAAARWLDGRDDLPVPPGTLGGAAAALRLAELVEAGLDEETRGMLVHFAVRVGTRRLADAAGCLDFLGLTEAASAAAGQARVLGGLQHPLVTGDDTAAAAELRRLAPGYDRLRAALG